MAQFCFAALHGYVKEDAGRALDSGVSGRARRMQLQVAQGTRELLLSLMVRYSSNVLFLALAARPDCPSGGGNVTPWWKRDPVERQ